jgi:hypothetical protein
MAEGSPQVSQNHCREEQAMKQSTGYLPLRARNGASIGNAFRSLAIVAALALAALLVPGVLSTPAASAAANHLFDPGLSLEGDCNAEDGIADPGCPYAAPNLADPTLGGPRHFQNPCGTTTDSYGDIYVASSIASGTHEGESWVDVFGPAGEYLTRVEDNYKSCQVAVDRAGNLYLGRYGGEIYHQSGEEGRKGVVRYIPSSYPPVAGTSYGPPTTVLGGIVVPETGEEHCESESCNIAVDPSNNHLYVSLADGIGEYGSAAEGNQPIPGEGEIGGAATQTIGDIDVCAHNHDIYALGTPSGAPFGSEETRLYVFDGSDGHKKVEVDGSSAGEISTDATPQNGFQIREARAAIAVDQLNCDVYVEDNGDHVVDQFSAAGAYLGQLPAAVPAPLEPGTFHSDLAVDDPSAVSEPGYHSPNEGYVYVTSGEEASNSHLFAFRPKFTGPPQVKAQLANGITETEAALTAQVNPSGVDTHYRFQYTTEASYVDEGFAGASQAPVTGLDAGEGGSFVPVSAHILALQPGTAYRFRLLAENEEGTTAGEGAPGGEGAAAQFSTYPSQVSAGACANDPIRAQQASTYLPDCRAYELVTPPDTNGRIPTLAGFGNTSYGASILTEPVSPDGESLLFGSEGGALPGVGGGGFHDAFDARRTAGGWGSSFVGVSGAQASEPEIGGFSSDHRYAFFEAKGSGSFPIEGGGVGAHYVHRPDGVIDPSCSPEPSSGFEWIGCGSLGNEPRADGKSISPGGDHVVFATENEISAARLQLEPCAAPTGTTAIYDRTADGVTHCISVKPDGTSFLAGEDATYLATSADGSAVAFRVGTTTYVRLDDRETIEVTGDQAKFADISQDGRRIAYLRPNPSQPLVPGTEIPQGEIFLCDVSSGPCDGAGATHESTRIGSGEASVIVNVSADGSHVYFVSPRQLAGSQGSPGAENLYLWDGSGVRFIATVTTPDVIGEEGASGGSHQEGLGLWVTNVAAQPAAHFNGPASDPSRTTPDGSVFVFQSAAALTGYDNQGHRQLFRYDSEAALDQQLACISCNPTGAAATSDASLQSDTGRTFAAFPPVNAAIDIQNIADDGRQIFFQSGDRLVPSDIDEKQDVYEWEADGSGGCSRLPGCISLISAGHSVGDDYLYAMTPDGRNVFFLSGDTLDSKDPDQTPSIYDARVEGGFAQANAQAAECVGETCQPAAPPPEDLTPASAAFQGSGNIRPAAPSRCPKGRRRVQGHGESRCVTRHKRRPGAHRAHRDHRTHSHRRAGR